MDPVSHRWHPALGGLLCLLALAARPATAAESLHLLSPEDGWLDIGDFLDKPYGFVPLVVPVTEPAIGYGAGGGLVFIDRRNVTENNRKPNIAAAMGLYTASNTWAGAAGYSGSFGDGLAHLMAGAMVSSMNLEYYGLGDSQLQDNPAQYNISMVGGMLGAAFRVLDSPVYVGLTEGLIGVKVSGRNDQIDDAELGRTTLAVLSPKVEYDSRDSMFTPRRGIYAEASVTGFFEQQRGAGRLSLVGIGVLPVLPSITLSAKADFGASLGKPPFYLYPFIMLRGVPLMRYVGELVTDLEVEVRWQFWRRLSVVGFGGMGATFSTVSDQLSTKVVFSGGGGLRYELSRKHQLHMGVDVAGSQAGPAVYIVFGSAWGRP